MEDAGMEGSDIVPTASDRAASASPSHSEEADTESQPSASVSDRAGTSQEAWPDVEDSRWVDVGDEEELNTWGNPIAPQPILFDPSAAFKDMHSEEDSDSGRSGDGWQSNSRSTPVRRQRSTQDLGEAIDESLSKRQRFLGSLHGTVRVPSSDDTMVSGTEEVLDDEERSSNDFQDPETEIPDKLILRPLNPSQQGRLVSLSEGNLLEYDGAESEESYDESSESEDLPAPMSCRNCTSELEPYQQICTECGHDTLDDASLFSHSSTALRATTEQGGKVMLVHDTRLVEHEEGKRAPHPERPDRITAVVARLLKTGLAEKCVQVPCREATAQEIVACHTEQLLDSVEKMSEYAEKAGQEIGVPTAYFTSDTYCQSSTYSCALLAAGGCAEVASAIARREISHGAAIVRPPGHHAESNMAMGFCFFNNAAVAARAAQKAGAEKVVILDWDIHHGNGTQHIFEDDPSVLYLSIHRWEGGHFFPGSGGPNEVGKGAGEGFTVNVPWPAGNMGDADYMAAFHHVVLPILSEYAPDLIIVSAGFDAAKGDPLGGCNVTSAGFAHMTALLAPIAPLALLLEGGYNLDATARGTEASLRVLLGERPPPLSNAGAINMLAATAIREVVKKQATYWRCLKPFVEMWGFDPYATPFTAEEALLLQPPSPSKPLVKPEQAASPSARPLGESQLLLHKSGHSVTAGSLDVSRALQRSKLAAQRQQGKSQRRFNYMHALHLVALRQRLKASRAISQKLPPLRVHSSHRQGSGCLPFTSPSPRTPRSTTVETSRSRSISGNPFSAAKPSPVADSSKA